MFNEQVDEQVWYTLQEASQLTGKTPSSLRRLIQRKIIERVKKEHSRYGEHWLIHKEEFIPQGAHKVFNKRSYVQGVHCERVESVQANVISFETYDQHRREWEQRCSQMEQGVMMYRFKFEELDRQLKLLPAPAEVVKSRLIELEHSLQEEKETKQKLINDLEAELQKERSLTWWQKLWAK